MINDETVFKEKNRVALISVGAAVLLTGMKLGVGIWTGSLGILSEALHSGLDFVAAFITYLAVRVSDKPPDEHHHYGHGKIENYSALIETLLLVITCAWIIYEAVHRILAKDVNIDVNVWSFVVIIISIAVDITRSRALMKVAKKYNSQALEADALHFTTDIYSSLVVLVGLVAFSLKDKFYGLVYADSVAALSVAMIVLGVSYRLGKRSFDALIDKAPEGIYEKIVEILKNVEDVKQFHDIRIRESGPYKFIEMNIHLDKKLDIETGHTISHNVEEAIKAQIFNCKVTVHIEPE